MIKAIIFDFFGVVYSDPYEVWLKDHGYARTGDFLKASQSMDLGRTSFDQFLDRLRELSGQDKEEIKAEFKVAKKLNYEVLKIVDSFRDNYKIGLLSNAPTDYIRDIMEENTLIEHFDEIVISAEVGCIKPNKEIFDIMLSRLGCESQDELFIDDNLGNIESARKIGLNVIHFENYEKLISSLRDMGLMSR